MILLATLEGLARGDVGDFDQAVGRLQFRAEGFNFLNRANYTFGSDANLNLTFGPDGKVNNPLFGTAVNKLGHRIIQLAVKYYF